MHNLPINLVLDEIKCVLEDHNRVVLQAPPGAGKTTGVPVALLKQAWLKNKQIILLEPRRIAARNAASRMAHILNEKVGETVGYQIRQDKCVSDKTKILVVTEGILTRKLQADPEQKNVALIIFDEFHERSLHADLSLALCLQSQQILRDDLKILVMSATLNTSIISNLLNNAPVIQSEGRSYAVDINYLDKPLPNRGNAFENSQQLLSQLINTIKLFVKQHQGNCLVFLPGVKEINQLSGKLQQYFRAEKIEHILIAPLHGNLTKQLQDQAISATKNSIRKIVLSTNIAETSLTIEGINCVIDSGLVRTLEYSPATGMNTLVTRSISQDSATQRSGRAGRLAAGVCYRMWTSQQQQRLQKYSVAEILHSDLSMLVLELANWGVKQVDELQWIDLPVNSSVEQAKQLLFKLDAIKADGSITQHGQDMLSLGTHPRLAHMMLSSAELNQAYHACLIASVLTERDLFKFNAVKSSDIYERLNILTEDLSLSRQSDSVDFQQCKCILQSANEFYLRLKRVKKVNGSRGVDKNFSGILLAYAYPDRMAKQRKHNESKFRLSNGSGADIPDYLQHNLYEYIVIANMKVNSLKGDASIFLMAEIGLLQIEEYFPTLIESNEIVEWNEKSQRVESKVSQSIGSMLIDEKMCSPENQDIVHQVLVSGIKKSGLQCLSWSAQAHSLVHRINFIRNQIKVSEFNLINDGMKLPDFSGEALLRNINDWLLPYLTNENSVKQCQKFDMFKLLDQQLSWEQKQLVDELAPLKFKVPSGSEIYIDYSDESQPVLAVRLQEVFGLYETPCILNGRYKLMMHLLSPARRPMQITQDLHSFWKTTYHDVKKELRGKYKRHYWPDDPFTAQATNKTKKNMQSK